VKAALKSQSGFTLVELVITATYVAAATAAIVGIFIVIGKLSKQSRNLAVATALAEQEVEKWRNSPYTAIPIGTPADDFSSSLPANFGSPKSALANITESPTGIKNVDVVVTYYDDNRPKKIELTTLIGQRGIDR
jgi:type II secretory pathway pseudopilin PulG